MWSIIFIIAHAFWNDSRGWGEFMESFFWNHFLESFLVGGGDLKTWPLKLESFFKGCCYSKAEKNHVESKRMVWTAGLRCLKFWKKAQVSKVSKLLSDLTPIPFQKRLVLKNLKIDNKKVKNQQILMKTKEHIFANDSKGFWDVKYPKNHFVGLIEKIPWVIKISFGFGIISKNGSFCKTSKLTPKKSKINRF